MASLTPIKSTNGFAYWGEREGWLIAYTQHRDSNTLDKANFAAIQRELEAIDESGDDYAIESFSSSFYGYGDHLLVRPGSECANKAEEIVDKLENVYPILNDELYSELEAQATEELWQQFGLQERIDYLKENGESIFAARCKTAGELYHRADITYYKVQHWASE